MAEVQKIPKLQSRLKAPERVQSRLINKSEFIVGPPGPKGDSLEFNWEGTNLGIRVEGEEEYEYRDLLGPEGAKGETGETGEKGDNALINGYNTITIEEGDNISIQQVDNVLRISNTYEYDDTDIKINIKSLEEITEELDKDLINAQNDIEALQEDTSKSAQDIVNINTTLGEHLEKINKNKEEIAKNNNAISGLGQEVLVNTQDIAELGSKIKKNTSDIEASKIAIQDNTNSINTLSDSVEERSLITETGNKIVLEIDDKTFVITAKLKDKYDNVISTSQGIDLPLESVVVDAKYNKETKEIELTLQNGTKVSFSVADLVSGLVSEDNLTVVLKDYAKKTDLPTALSELENDMNFIDDTYHDITKQNTIDDLDDIRDGANKGKTALQSFTEEDPTVPRYVKDITEENISSWNNKSDFSGDYNDLINQPHIPEKVGELENDKGYLTEFTEEDPTVPDYVKSISEDNINSWNNKQNELTKSDKDLLVKESLIDNENELSDEEKSKIESWLGLAENYLTYYNETPYQATGDYNPTPKKYVDERIAEVEMFKFPNATIIGTPTIQAGQVSDFTTSDYLEFPFLVDFRGRPFEINFAFTTGTNVTSQQNILDSDFGLAFAVRNSHLVMALSFNGTSWATEQVGSLTLQPQTTYRIKITWNGLSYKVQYSTDGGNTYIDDITFGSNQAPYPKQMYIGVGKLADNYFEGIINLNYANVKINGQLIWQGMDDVGLASRLATDLSNIDQAGVNYINGLIDIKVNNTLVQLDAELQNIDTGSGV